jgi:2-haloacid dehalogenase
MSLDYDWIFFDLDGTLFDHFAASAVAIESLSQDFGYDHDEFIENFHEVNDQCWAMMSRGEIDMDRLRYLRFELLLPRIDSNPGQDQSIEMADVYLSLYLSNLRYFDEAEVVLMEAAKRAKVAIFTNAPHVTQDIKINHLGETVKYIDQIVCSDDVNAYKPSLEFYRKALELVGGGEPSRLLMVGDSWEADIEPPHELGWDTAWISHGQSLPKELKSNRCFENLAEFYEKLLHS